MILEKLILEDFLTYERLEHTFEKRPLMVQGLNLTDERQKSNGSGKSGMQTGIEFCITATNSRGVSDKELVSFGQKEARVQLIASCDVRKERIHIDWVIKIKGSNKLTLTKQAYNGDWEEISFSNVNDGKKYILAWFAISKEDLFNYYIINKTRFKSFFKSSNKEKVDLINRFSDASIVEGLEKIDNTELQFEYDNLKTEISKLEGKVEITEENITKEENRDFKSELDEVIGDIKEEIESIEEKIDVEKATIEDIEKQKIECNKDIELAKSSIVEIEELKKPILKKIAAEEKLLESVKIDLISAEGLVKEFVKTDWGKERKDYELDLKEDNKNLDSENKVKEKQAEQETKILKVLKDIEVKLGGKITCPSCSTDFILDGNLDELEQKKSKVNSLKEQLSKNQKKTDSSIIGVKKSITSLEKDIAAINKKEELENSEKNKLVEAVNAVNSKISVFEKNIANLKKEIVAHDSDITEENNALAETELELKQLDISIDNCNKSISNYNTEIKNYKTEIDNKKVGNNKAIIKGLKFELSVFKDDIKAKSITLQELGDKIYSRNQWATNFKQFRMYLANQSLEAIEFHCNRYLSGMGSDLKVKMEGYKMLANGTYKDEITAKVVRGTERTFQSFSGGEQGRLLFASILANRHMINSTHPYGGLDFLSVDEVFEGVDSIGLKHLVRSAKQLEICVMLITHVTDEEVGEDTLLIVKENGISSIRK